MIRRAHQRGGYTSVELLLVVALSALVIGGAVVSYGTLTRSMPSTSSVISVPLGLARMQNFFGLSSSSSEVAMAPQFGALAEAEVLREQFVTDTISATAVFCLGRDNMNTWRPAVIAYNPTLHAELDTPQKFRAHVVANAGVAASLYRDYRNPLNDGAAVPQNASIFILGYSKYAGYLQVNAIYDIDFVRFTAKNEPTGIHASVKRYGVVKEPPNPALLTYTGDYEVFYPPSVMNGGLPATDGFAPLFVTFERATRLALREGTTTDRFKRASERPFYMIWWPDPSARHLGAIANTFSPTDPRQAYNHMAGRTAFMFVVPMFPAL